MAGLFATQETIKIFADNHRDSTAYHHTIAMNISGRINEDCFRKSLQELMVRHEILRSRIINDNENSVFEAKEPKDLAADVNPPLKIFLHPNEQKLPLTQLLDELDPTQKSWLLEPFDLEREPLWRVSLIKRTDESFQLVFVLHHIIVDVTSQNILLDNLSELYKSFLEARQVSLPTIKKLSDYDFTAHHQEQKINYWQTKLANLNTVQIHTDLQEEETFKFKGDRCYFRVNAELIKSLEKIAAEYKCKLNAILLTGFYSLLNRYSGEQDICLGLVSANREGFKENVDDVVNCFINSIPLRVNLDAKQSVSSQLVKVDHAVKSALENQLPLDIIMQRAMDTKSNATNNLATPFNILYNFNKEKTTLNLLGTIASAPVEVNLQNSRVQDFGINLDLQKDGSIEGYIEFNNGRYNKETIKRLVEHLQIIWHAIAADPTQSINTIPILTEEEKALLDEFHASSQPQQTSTHELFPAMFSRIAKQQPQKTCIVFHGEDDVTTSLTYEQVEKMSDDLALHLLQNGIKAETPVAFCLTRSPNLLIATLAVMKAGGTIVPLGVPDNTQANLPLYQKIKQINIEHIIVDKKTENFFSDYQQQLLRMNLDKKNYGLPVKDLREKSSLPQIQPNQRAYIIHTSGSTGTPKAVEQEHKILANLGYAIKKRNLPVGSKVLPIAPSDFDAFYFELLEALCTEGEIHLINEAERLSPQKLEETISKYEINCITVLPDVLENLTPKNLPSLRDVICMGALPNKATLLHWYAYGITIRNELGLTETGICNTDNPFNPEKPYTDVGRPIPGTMAFILDDNLNVVPFGVPGELYFGGELCLARGYFNDPELTKKSFPTLFYDSPTHTFAKTLSEVKNQHRVPQPMRLYPTGDLACYVPGSEKDKLPTINLLGRKDQDQVKIFGVRIELPGLINLLKKHPNIKDVVVLPKPTKDGLTAYIIPNGNHSIDKDNLDAYLAETTAPFLTWPAIVLMKQFPRHNGKIDLKALKAPEEKRIDLPKPQTKLQEELVQLWAEVLHTNAINITKTFAQHGGTSMQLANLERAINKKFTLNKPANMKILSKDLTIITMEKLLKNYMIDPNSGVMKKTKKQQMGSAFMNKKRLCAKPLNQLKEGENKNTITRNNP